MTWNGNPIKVYRQNETLWLAYCNVESGTVAAGSGRTYADALSDLVHTLIAAGKWSNWLARNPA